MGSNGNGESQVGQVVEIINKLKPETRSQVIQRVTMAYSGPLPMASEFEKYELACPGAGNIILNMADRQSIHRQELEKSVVLGNQKRSNQGQIFAFILGLTGILGGLYLVSIGKDVQGFGTVIGAIATLVGIFVYGRKAEANERIEKSRK